MDEKDKKDLEGVSEEEKELEEEAQKEVKDDELRESLAEDFELDPEEDKEILDRLVDREKAHRERLSGAIKQKINWREKAKSKETSEDPKDTPGDKDTKSDKDGEPESADETARRIFREERDKEALDALDLPDELKDEIKDLAKMKGISVREAAKLPYILSRKEEVEKEERLNKATPKRSKTRGSVAPVYDPSKPLNPDDYDFDSEEGVKAWQEDKAARAKYQAEQAKNK